MTQKLKDFDEGLVDQVVGIDIHAIGFGAAHCNGDRAVAGLLQPKAKLIMHRQGRAETVKARAKVGRGARYDNGCG